MANNQTVKRQTKQQIDMKAILITGGAGFIGSHVVRMFVKKYPRTKIINYDKLTYAGNLSNLKDIENRKNYVFVKGDVMDYKKVFSTMKEYGVEGVIHFAAESHVDRSIKDPFAFAKTNVIGTLTMLQAAKEFWGCSLANAAQSEKKYRFYHISTDEVYAELTTSLSTILEYSGVKNPISSAL